MKKLIIVAAAMIMTIVANAASYNWDWTTSSSLKDYSGNVLGSGISVSIFAEGYASALDSVLTDANGKVTGNFDAFTVVGADETTPSYKFYLTYTDAAGNTFQSASLTKQAAEVGSASLSFSDSRHLSAAKGTWTTAAVPEPTSGLLLLCGLAGLALRRKRA